MKKPIAALLATLLCALPLAGWTAAYTEIAVHNGGAISGRVILAGKDYAPRKYRVAKDNSICGEEDREIDFVRVVNGALQDVVVYLDDIKSGKPFPADVGDITTVQEACEFKPFLGVMRNNARFFSVNKDPVLHNIHTYELMGRVKKTVFNVSQPDQNTISQTVKLKRGAAMKVECDAHDFMHAYTFVAKNPYFAIVGEDGRYRIDNVPPGRYRIKAWHGFLKDQKAEVEVTAGATVTVDFAFKNK